MVGFIVSAETPDGPAVVSEAYPRPYLVAINAANADLIAAAPDLLTSLEEHVAAFDRQVADYRRGGSDEIARIAEQVHGKRMDRARIAIAKARGTR